MILNKKYISYNKMDNDLLNKTYRELQGIARDRIKTVPTAVKRSLNLNLNVPKTRLIEIIRTEVPTSYKEQIQRIKTEKIKFPTNVPKTALNVFNVLKQVDIQKNIVANIKKEVFLFNVQKRQEKLKIDLFKQITTLETFNLERDANKILAYIMKKVDITKPFKVIFKSLIIDSFIERTFKNIDHFKLWFTQLATKHEDSQGNITTSFNELYINVRIQVNNVSGGCLRATEERTIVNRRNTYTIYNPASRLNNCGLECLRYLMEEYRISRKGIDDSRTCLALTIDKVPSCLELRKEFNIPTNTRVSVDMMLKIHKKYFEPLDKDCFGLQPLKIIEYDYERPFNGIYFLYIQGNIGIFADHLFLLKDDHYSIITEIKPLEREKATNIRRVQAVLDIETRKTDEYKEVESIYKDEDDLYSSSFIKTSEKVKTTTKRIYKIKDTILEMCYKTHVNETMKRVSFKTMNGYPACRQFLDWLILEDKHGHNYNFVAHNGSNFDYLIIASYMSENEIKVSNLFFKGLSLLKFEFHNHRFIDSARHLTASLSNLCNDYKIEDGKLVSLNYNGITMTNEQLCFYKPDLSFDDFMDLENTEQEFWKLYTTYCYRDTTCLYDIWKIYSKDISDIVKVIASKLPTPKLNKKTGKVRENPLLKVCRSVNMFPTISSLCIKMYEFTYKNNPKYKEIEKFIEYDDENGTGNYEKYMFIRKQVRGGISHNNKKIMTNRGVMSVDQTSQYPAAQLTMKIPIGESVWGDRYDDSKYGYYQLDRLEFFDYAKSFKPVSFVGENGVLNWNTGTIIEGEIYIDSWMLKYLRLRIGLKSFRVVKSLLSDSYVDGEEINGLYVNTLFNEKRKQDAYNDSKDIRYNNSYRSTIKLALNAVPGKQVEQVEKYDKTEYTYDNTMETKNPIKKMFQGINIARFEKRMINRYIMQGIGVYSQSKMNYFEYINCFPNKADDVIQSETDSIYFMKDLYSEFKKNVENYICPTGFNFVVAFGGELAQIKPEEDTDEICYFVGKKLYLCGSKTKLKGIPPKTITPNGTHVPILYTRGEKSKKYDLTLSREIFNNIVSGKTQKIKYSSLEKCIYGEENTLNIYTTYKTRVVNAVSNVIKDLL
jgi:hypothetical protein